uniref:Uncharacterized protein n=1 Tax=Arundo donax TaxID=35708 RepID=A0A0A9CHC4_ARUDO
MASKLVLPLSLSTASTASSAKYSLSWERIFELSVVIAIFMRSDLNLSVFSLLSMVLRSKASLAHSRAILKPAIIVIG